jgi:hypothetical protein
MTPGFHTFLAKESFPQFIMRLALPFVREVI